MRRDTAVIPFYWCFDEDRAEIARRVFRHYDGMFENVIGVGSEGDLSRELFLDSAPHGTYVEYQQTWEWMPPCGSPALRDKFNAGFQTARMFEPERVWLVASDDLITEGLFSESDADLIGAGVSPQDENLQPSEDDGGFYMWDYPRPTYRLWNHQNPGFADCEMFGAMGFSSSLLDAWDWTPYMWEHDEIGVERRARSEDRSLDVRKMDRDGFAYWNIKCGKTLNPFGAYENFGLSDAPECAVKELADLWQGLNG